MMFRKESDKVYFWPVFAIASILALEEAIETLLDEIVVGNVFDDVAFGAINLVQPYMTLVNFVSYLICVGGAALIVRAHGRNDKKTMDRLFSHSVTCCLAVGILFCCVYLLFADRFVWMVAGGSSQYEGASAVFFWQCFYAGAFPLCVFLQTYVLYMGGYLICGCVTVFGMLLNPFLSVLIGKTIGVGGIMLATVLVNIIEITLLLMYIVHKRYVRDFGLHINLEFLKKIITLGLGESSIFFAVAIMEFSANSVAVSRYGTAGIVVISVVIDLLEMVIYISEGISEYETVALNEYLGRQDTHKIGNAMKTCTIACIVEGIVFSCLFAIVPKMLLNMFDVDDVRTMESATSFVRLLIIAPIFICFTRIKAIYYQYTDRIPCTIGIIFGAWGLFPAVFCYLLGRISLYGLVLGLVIGVCVVPILLGGSMLIKGDFVDEHPIRQKEEI